LWGRHSTPFETRARHPCAQSSVELQTAGLFTGTPVFDIALETWQIGGTYLFGDDDARARPFVAVGLGLTRLLPEPTGLSDETRFSASFGAGVKLWLGRHFGIRLEGRSFFTVLDSDSQPFCGGASGCVIRTTSSELSQAEARAGLILRFSDGPLRPYAAAGRRRKALSSTQWVRQWYTRYESTASASSTSRGKAPSQIFCHSFTTKS
jgi:hypothetical protein